MHWLSIMEGAQSEPTKIVIDDEQKNLLQWLGEFTTILGQDYMKVRVFSLDPGNEQEWFKQVSVEALNARLFFFSTMTGSAKTRISIRENYNVKPLRRCSGG